MKKTVLLIAALCAGPASAEWMKVVETNDALFYIDPATVRKDGQLRKVWMVFDLKKRDLGGELSSRAQREYDCKNETQRLLYLSTHTGPMSTGETLSMDSGPYPWSPIPPNTPNETLLKLVCR